MSHSQPKMKLTQVLYTYPSQFQLSKLTQDPPWTSQSFPNYSIWPWLHSMECSPIVMVFVSISPTDVWIQAIRIESCRRSASADSTSSIPRLFRPLRSKRLHSMSSFSRIPCRYSACLCHLHWHHFKYPHFQPTHRISNPCTLLPVYIICLFFYLLMKSGTLYPSFPGKRFPIPISRALRLRVRVWPRFRDPTHICFFWQNPYIPDSIT